MSTITLNQDYGYTDYRVSDLADGTVIDASGASWIHDNDDSDGQSNPYPFMVYDSADVVLKGGTIDGNINQTDAWRDVYDAGNSAAIRTEGTPNVVISDWRISNTWDAIRVSWDSPDFLIEDVWVTDARDDAIENDRLQSGTIRDSLFDGVFAGLSIDPSSSSPVDGSDETILLDGVLMRLELSLYEGEMTHASFIKTDSATDGAVTPNLRFIDCVIAIEDVNHRSYRSMFDTWNHTIQSENNYYLNLSDEPLPDDYPMPPAGWTVLQGQEARDFWKAARDAWVAEHADGAGNITVEPVENIVTSGGGTSNVVIDGTDADDILIGTAVNNRFNGGSGFDVVVVEAALADVSRAVLNPNGSVTIVTPQGTDTTFDVELFDFLGTLVTANALLNPFSISPSAGADLLVGAIENNQFDGGDGEDTLIGGGGNDGLKGGNGDDLLSGVDGDDRLPGSNGNDTILGGDGNDRLGGGDGNDHMDGGAGNDGGGAGPGKDTVIGGDGNDRFNGGLDDDVINLGAGNDTSGGSFGNDTMRGGAGDDYLGGANGNDSIDGGDGNDTIISGYGDDTVVGGAGADLFVFNTLSSGGTTIITDFEDGIDTIRLTGLRNPADPVARLDITDTTISEGEFAGQTGVAMTYGDHTIIVLGATEANFSTDDFLFT